MLNFIGLSKPLCYPLHHGAEVGIRIYIQNTQPIISHFRTAAESTKGVDSEEPPEVMPSTSSSASMEDTVTPAALWFHNYNAPTLSTEDKLEAAQKEIVQLQEEFAKQRDRGFFLQRFGSDPSLINFYTGFKDFATLKSVFEPLKPTAITMIRWSQIQRNSDLDI